MGFTVQVDNHLGNWCALAIGESEVVDTGCTESILIAVFLTVLSNKGADVIVVKEVAYFTFVTFASSTLAFSFLAVWVLSGGDALAFFGEVIEISALDAFGLVVLFSAIKVGSDGRSNWALSMLKLEILPAFETIPFTVGFQTVLWEQLALSIGIDVVAINTFGTDSVIVGEEATVG